MASRPTWQGRVRYLKLGHGTNPAKRMKNYTESYSGYWVRFSILVGGVARKTELKPIKRSLKVWPILGDAEEAKRIEAKLGWILHEKLALHNKYLAALKQHRDGRSPSYRRVRRTGKLIWNGAKELFELGPVTDDKVPGVDGPTAKYQAAIKEIDSVLNPITSEAPKQEWALHNY